VQLGAMLWQVHEGEHVGLSIVHQGGEFRHAWPGLIGDLSSLCLGGSC